MIVLIMIKIKHIKAKKIISDKLFKYLLAGGATVATEYGSFVLLSYLIHNLLVNNAVSFILSLIVGFTLNKIWVFQSSGNSINQLAAYLILATINLILSSLFISIAVNLMQLNPYIAKVFTMLIIAGSNYLLFSKFIFGSKRAN